MNKDDRFMLYAMTAFVGILAFGTVSYSWLEGWSLLDSLYFTLYTVLTVGFGDLEPSPENRLFTAFFILTCTTISIACVAVIGNWIVSLIQRNSAARRKILSDKRADAVKEALGNQSEESDD